MYSAFSSRASPSGINSLYNALQYPVPAQRCNYLGMCFNDLPVKELHQFFPRLLSNVFGYDGTQGWNLASCSRKYNADSEFEHVFQFLAPGGHMFRLIAKLEDNDFLYEFPISCLPHPSQELLKEGKVPAFYEEKLHLSLEAGQGVPDQIIISAFEYYMFHFVYYLIFIQSSPYPLWINFAESLYTSLFEAYLSHFLPFEGPIPSSIISPGNVHAGGLTSPPANIQSIVHRGLYSTPVQSPSYTPSLLRSNGGGVRTHRSVPTVNHLSANQVGTLQAEIFIQILVEFWLNQSDNEITHGDLLSQTTNQPLLSIEHIRLIKQFIKHVLYFINGSSHPTSPVASPFHSPITTVTETLRDSIVPVYLQAKLYKFIRYCFKHWPLDGTFRFVLELWLTYLQPWRYSDHTKPPAENKISLEQTPRRWQVYVNENFPFYSSLFVEFLVRSFQLNLTTGVGVILLSRVAKVFAQNSLVEFLRSAENILLSTNGASISPSSSSSVHLSSLKALFDHLEGPGYSYHPLFNSATTSAIQLLLDKVAQARTQLESKTHNEPEKELPVHTPPPPLDSFAQHPPLQQQNPKKSGWFSSLVSDLFSEQGQHPYQASHLEQMHAQTDPEKLIALLDSIEVNFRTMFQISVVHSPAVDGRLEPHLRRSTSGGNGSPPASLLSPEYEKGSTQLTAASRRQAIQGLRVCSSSKVKFLGDPLLQPVRSYENLTIVRQLYYISHYLNNKFASQLKSIGSSNRFHCKLLKQLLAPPPPSSQPNQSEYPPSTPLGRVSAAVHPGSLLEDNFPAPRINLRMFGSYYTLAALLVFACIVMLLPVPVWVWFGLVIVCLFLYSVIKYLAS